MMPGVDFNAVRQLVSMEDVLRLLQFRPTSRRGDALRGPCPVHRAESAASRSFSVNVRLGRYQCFHCGSRGNALELWAAAHAMGIHEAAVNLCEVLRIEVPWKTRW